MQTLFDVAEDGTADDVQRLIGAGADVNARNDEGGTAFMLAAETNEYAATAQTLIALSADNSLKDAEGRTARDLLDKNIDILIEDDRLLL